MPDLLRLTALYELVKGQQPLCMGPSGELRNPVQNLLWGVLLVRNELTAMHSQAWSRPRAAMMNMFVKLKTTGVYMVTIQKVGKKSKTVNLFPPEHEETGRRGS